MFFALTKFLIFIMTLSFQCQAMMPAAPSAQDHLSYSDHIKNMASNIYQYTKGSFEKVISDIKETGKSSLKVIIGSAIATKDLLAQKLWISENKDILAQFHANQDNSESIKKSNIFPPGFYVQLPHQGFPQNILDTFEQERTKHIEKKLQQSNENNLLPEEEINWLSKLKTKDIKKFPRIALAMSGGGCRAALGASGFLVAMQDSGILDLTRYISVLSGSSWFTASWMLSNNPSIQNYSQTFIQNMGSNKIIDDILEKEHIRNTIFRNYYINEVLGYPCSRIVEMYGNILSYLFFGLKSEPTQLTLSSLRDTMNEGKNPLFIGTAVMNIQSAQNVWLEINPFFLGGIDIGWTDLEFVGSKFIKFKPTSLRGELPLGYYLGTMGSAMTTDFGWWIKKYYHEVNDQEIPFLDIKKETLSKLQESLMDSVNKTVSAKSLTVDFSKMENIPANVATEYLSGIQKIIKKESAGIIKKFAEDWEKFSTMKAFSGAKFFNPIYISEQEISTGFGAINNFSKNKELELFDAGLGFNIPFPPLYEESRNVDIIIVCNMGAGSAKGEFNKARQFFAGRNINFYPEEAYSYIDSKNFQILGDPSNPNDKPLIIYISPMTPNSSLDDIWSTHNLQEAAWASTFEFNYKKEHADIVHELTKKTVEKNIGQIRKAILDKADALFFNTKALDFLTPT